MGKSRWPLILGGIVLACLCVSVIGAGIAVWQFSRFINEDTPIVIEDTPEPEVILTPAGPPSRSTVATVVAAPTVTARPLPAGAQPPASPDAIFANVMPKEDLVAIAERYKGAPRGLAVECAVRKPEYNVGDRREFTLSNSDTDTLFKITAELRYKNKDVYAWVEVIPEALKIDGAQLQRAMDRFSTSIVPVNRAFFGSEANPGVDCDPHMHILHASGVGRSVGGYFSTPDGFPKSVREDSNEGELFVMHAAPGYNGASPDTTTYLSTLAHEYQHMISHNNNHAPDLWLEEGAAQLAERLNGYGSDAIAGASTFTAKPETQLTIWDESSAGGNSAHYGAAYLWWSYVYDRFGEGIAKQLAREPERSATRVMRALATAGVVDPDTGKPYRFEELFADWVVANYNSRQAVKSEPAPNRYNYGATSVPPVSLRARLSAANYPYTKHDTLNQFGTHYIELRGTSPVNIDFSGATLAGLMPMADADGIFWWSSRGDVSDSRLTREFDLSAARNATLKFRAWYRVEESYDYGYVSVSTDGGATWSTLHTTSCTTEDPNKANLGCGYTGSSGSTGSSGGSKGSAPPPVWRNESADLSPYAGRKILLRFEVITDAAVHREGLAVDNIEIPEIGFKDDAYTVNGWKSEGFVRTDNRLPQTWAVQLIATRDDNTRTVTRMTLDAQNSGSLSVDLGNGVKSAVLAISPTTLVTTEPAAYDIKVR